MSSFRRELFYLSCATFFSLSSLAQPATTAALPKSPVAQFRELLKMSPEDRRESIALRPPDIQKRILEKLTEYEILPGDLREQRLRETELRWYLRPLMDEPRTNRAARLALIPEEERQLVAERLQLWDTVPPSLQQQWTNYDLVANYFAQLQTTSDDMSETSPPEGLERWKQMSADQRRQALAGFNRFFVLPPEEKDKSLDAVSEVSETERQQMKQTLADYGKLTPMQRKQCISSFEKFANMSLAERNQFLKNVERWKEMTAEEREKWRQLVTVAPIMPPIDSGPPKLPSHSQRLTPPMVAPTVVSN